MDHQTKIISSLIQKDIGLESADDPASETELLSAIIDRVAWMLEYDMDLLMSYLYRLDILEHRINTALMPGSPMTATEALGVLILERQKERVATKKKYKQNPIEGWEY